MRKPIWTSSAQKELRRLDRSTQTRIIQAVDRLAADDHGDVRRVQEKPGEFALRVGDWRIFYRHDSEMEGKPPKLIEVLRVLRIRSRGHAYGR